MDFLVKPGERIPADGVVDGGGSHVDESVLTGESAPLAKRPGDAVMRRQPEHRGRAARSSATRVGAASTLAPDRALGGNGDEHAARRWSAPSTASPGDSSRR